MLMTGLMVFLGVALILAKLPRRMMLKALYHDVALDLTVSAIVLAIHEKCSGCPTACGGEE